MPRPKGSKNKTTKAKAALSQNDYETKIAQQVSEKESLTEQIASINENMEQLKAELKAKKTALKQTEKEITRLEAEKTAYEAEQFEKAKKAELDDAIHKMMDGGMSIDDILEKLK